MIQLCAWRGLKKLSRLNFLLYLTGEEIREARALAKQLSTEDTSAPAWKARHIPQPRSEAAVSSRRQGLKLAGLLLYGRPPEPLPLVCQDCCLRLEQSSMAFCASNNPPQLAFLFYSKL